MLNSAPPDVNRAGKDSQASGLLIVAPVGALGYISALHNQ